MYASAKQYDAAFTYFSRAAKLGLMEAVINIGVIYYIRSKYTGYLSVLGAKLPIANPFHKS
jgi:hypothetical protein